MFGLLKNKISSFINNLTGRDALRPAGEGTPSGQKPEEGVKKAAEEAQKPSAEKLETPSHTQEAKPPQAEEIPTPQPMEIPAPSSSQKTEEAPSKPAETPAPYLKGPSEPQIPSRKKEESKQPKKEIPLAKKQPEIPMPAAPAQIPPSAKMEIPAPVEIPRPAHSPALAEKKPGKAPQKPPAKTAPGPFMPLPAEKEAPDLSRLEKRAGTEKRGEIAPKIGLGAAIKSFFTNEVTIGEGDVSDLLSELEFSLLEADVAYDVSTEVIAQLRSRLVGMKAPKGEVAQRTRQAVQLVLESVMDSGRKFDFVEKVKSLPRPVKILFVGPNGAGKTTTMAKLASMLMRNGLTAVFSASDTFRAAAIEQTEVHGGRLGVKVIKSKYGADPASVAFDAINYARANGVDVVLIDSAGRQDTNANLLSELVKINRIAKPDIKIYVGESYGGNSVIGQIQAFNEAIGMDGAILTKIDCDAKGGTAISIARSTGIPVLFLGVGQAYDDLVPFDPRKIAQEIMS